MPEPSETSLPDEQPWGYRTVRHLTTATESPWPGVLARSGGEPPRLLVAEEDLPDSWRGWQASADGHVLAPIDVARRRAGHHVVLPHCVERLADFLARRHRAGTPLTDGEIVTLVVSLLRGIDELAGSPGTAQWWLTATGRPVCATEVGSCGAAEAASELCGSLDPAGAALARTLTEIRDRLAACEGEPGELAACEQQLFAAATPEPLAMNVLPPRPARAEGLELDDAHAASPDDTPTRRSVREETSSHGLIWRLGRHLDAEWADAASRALQRVTRAPQRVTRVAASSSRRGKWIAAATAGALVLGGGALWPQDDTVADARDAQPTSPATESPATDGHTLPEAVAAAGSGSLGHSLATLLDARTECGADERCLASVMEDPTRPLAAGAVDLPPDRRSITLVDDFGGAAVLRVDATDAETPAQLVVVVVVADRWLLRDVYAAEQP